MPDRKPDPLPKRWALSVLYGIGWHLGPRLPGRLRAGLAGFVARQVMRRQPAALREFRRNLALAGAQPVTDTLVRLGVESYLRNFLEVFALPGWSRAEVIRRVCTVDEHHLRQAYASTGAVIALPHSGNWDLAGAWACATGMPVTSVAEALEGPELAAFSRFRRGLGMEIVTHTDPTAIATLIAAVRNRRLVCLMADRDLLGTGLPVHWRGQAVTMPAGPALVARRTGAALIPAVCRFEPAGMVITFGAPVAARPGRDGLTAMTQDVATFFADQIARQPADWHLMQPFFPAAQSPQA